MSAILRRWLVERAMATIAAPRCGKVFLREPDNKPVNKTSEKQRFVFFASAGASVFGVEMRALTVTAGVRREPMGDFDPERTVNVRLDNFLSQRVLCLQAQWVSRGDVIKYAANIASGVHSGAAKDRADHILQRIRQCAIIKVTDGHCSVGVNLAAIEGHDPPLAYDPAALDPVLVELLSCAHFIIKSDDTRRLESIVAQEIGANSLPQTSKDKC
jgi:hypothetical protein